ncbi:hypothetical protein HYQ45_001425 [Verticillium longisporum]|uniref:Uncharacterized protein n=1 Tax=Verticillium longisporum TaxID=100787 RepID=A0A8I3AWR1_VERLO|nr:hypothetical protein HYQ45_001425 [Verticillium longisporum]
MFVVKSTPRVPQRRAGSIGPARQIMSKVMSNKQAKGIVSSGSPPPQPGDDGTLEPSEPEHDDPYDGETCMATAHHGANRG